jgi:MraZ protein
MDAKGRLAIPAKVRDQLTSVCQGRFVVTADIAERCLLVYPESYWPEVVNKVQALPNANRLARKYQRLILGMAASLELDANGRVLLPQTLRDYAFLDKKLIMVGQGAKLEIWSDERWNAMLNEEDGDAELTDELKNLSV